MDKLYKPYTSPSQSRELLELGVPRESADMVYNYEDLEDYANCEDEIVPKILYRGDKYFDTVADEDLPCWSVGRLTEIFLMTSVYRDIIYDNRRSAISQAMDAFKDVKKNNLFDFSRLKKS